MNARDKTYEQLSAHLDGELSPPEAERLARTLEADEDLRRELAELAAVRDLLRSVPIERAPDDLAGSVLAEAERSQLVGRARAETPTGALRWIRYLATAAVLLVAVAVGAIIAVTLWSPPRPEYET
ncbi:MAG: RseA family anti-sigma factor, partial [Phycisphaerae bacterium]